MALEKSLERELAVRMPSLKGSAALGGFIEEIRMERSKPEWGNLDFKSESARQNLADMHAIVGAVYRDRLKAMG